MLASEVLDELGEILHEPILKCATVEGGCIANACRLETEHGIYFLKWSTRAVAKTFSAEASGLDALRLAGSPLHIPRVIGVKEGGGERPGILLMDWIETGEKGLNFWEDFGRGLAHLHQYASDRYGFERDNYIGHLPQQNAWEIKWPDFFRMHRLEPQVELARERGLWQKGWDTHIDFLYERLEEYLPPLPQASLLHGDLWSGNFMVTASGVAALIDPAVYHGHQEADLAMTELFGGFDSRFYESYKEVAPVEPGYELRRDIYNLYHLINHLNHFGGSYASSVANILKQFR